MTDAKPIHLRDITISSLQKEHDLSRFCCGADHVDYFAKRKAAKSHNSHRTKVFCAHIKGSHNVIGLYALSIVPQDAIALKNDEREVTRKPFFSSVYIQSIGVLRHYQCQGVGTILLLNALRRCYWISQNAGLFAVALHSLNERTTKLYERYGFDQRTDEQLPLMILPILSLVDLFERHKAGS